jgi:hypothetical protein
MSAATPESANPRGGAAASRAGQAVLTWCPLLSVHLLMRDMWEALGLHSGSVIVNEPQPDRSNANVEPAT